MLFEFLVVLYTNFVLVNYYDKLVIYHNISILLIKYKHYSIKIINIHLNILNINYKKKFYIKSN